MTTPLENAASALAQHRAGDALDDLLEVWRESRSVEVGDLIEALSPVLSRGLPAIEGRTRNEFQTRWLDIANAQRPVDLGRVLTCWTEPPNTHIHERVLRLLQWPEDPRVARGLARLMVELPSSSGIPPPTWNKMLRALAQLRDRRAGEILETRGGPRNGDFDRGLTTKLPELVAALKAVTPVAVDAAQLQAVRSGIERLAAQAEPPKLASHAGPRREDTLLEQIWARPEDDAPRSVYADYLLERGDPRGEFIALQLKAAATEADGRRARALAKQHGRSWLGPIEPSVAPKSEAFSRGFLGSCRFQLRTDAQRKAHTGHPAWNTVTKLGGPARVIQHEDFVLQTPLLGLEELEGLVDPLFAMKMATRETPYPRFQRMMLYLPTVPLPDEQLRVIGDGRAFPRMNGMALLGSDGPVRESGLDWLLDSAIGKRLEWLDHGRPDELLLWMPRLLRCPTLKHIKLRHGASFIFTRLAEGWRATVECAVPLDDGWVYPCVELIRSVAREVALPRARPGFAEERSALRERLRGLAVIEV